MGRRIVDAAVGGGHEDGLSGQRVHNLDVLDTHEAQAVQIAALHRGAVPADTDLVGVGLVDLLVSVTQLIGRFAADSRVVIRVCRTALLDRDVGIGGPGGGQCFLDTLRIIGREDDVLRGGRVVRCIVVVVVPGDLDTVGRTGGQRVLHLEDVALHAAAVGILLGRARGLGDAVTGHGDDPVAALGELEAVRRDGAGQRQLDLRALTGGGHRGAGEVNRRDLLVVATQGFRVIDDVEGQGRLVFRDRTGTARAGLILGGNPGGGSLGASFRGGSLGASFRGGGFNPGLGGGRGGHLSIGRGRGSFLGGRYVRRLRAFVGGAGSHGEGCQRRDEKRESSQTGSTRNAHTGAERTQSRHRLLLLSTEYGQDLCPSLVKDEIVPLCLTVIASTTTTPLYFVEIPGITAI